MAHVIPQNGSDLCLCLNEYYTEWSFLRERKLWIIAHMYNPLVVVMYNQNPLITFFFFAIYESLEELSLGLSILLKIPHLSLKSEWDPGDALISDIFAGVFGIALGMWIVRLIKKPKTPGSRRIFLKKNHGQPNYVWWMLRIKYYVQILLLVYVPSNLSFKLAFTTRSPHKDFVPDALSYLVLHFGIIWLYFVWNYRDIRLFWRIDRERYLSFHVIWSIVLVLMMIPSVIPWTDFSHLQAALGFASAAVFLAFLSSFLVINANSESFKTNKII